MLSCSPASVLSSEFAATSLHGRPGGLPAGWRPLPFKQFILKVASRCNLKCDYCYMYEMADDSWREQPKIMPPQTVLAAARRIAEHADTHRLPSMQVVLHGGELLLPGPGYIDAAAATLRATIGAAVDLRVQTNGTSMPDSMLDVLIRHDIRVGISLDGARQANDRHRRYANGRGSYDVVSRSLQRLRARAPQLFSGILCTIDLSNNPVETYEALNKFAPPVVDFLLPHGNWTNPPPGRDPGTADAPYGRWLAEIFDHWYARPPQHAQVRMFSEIIGLLLGRPATVETIGLTPVSLIVIDANGAMEQVDTLRSAYPGAIGTGLNVHANGFDEAIGHPDIVARQRGRSGLSAVCQNCVLHPVCGGGLYVHRYRAGTGFMNPSVFCADLAYLIRHIHRRVRQDVARLRPAGR